MAIPENKQFAAIGSDLRPQGRAIPAQAGLSRIMPVLASVTAPLTFAFVFLRRQSEIARESGPMENFQAVCIFAGLIMLVICSRLARSRPERIFVGGLALLYATLLVLEIDLRKADMGWVNLIWNGRIRDGWLGVLWLTALWMFLRNRKPAWTVFTAQLRRSSGRVLLAAGACWILAGMVDKGLGLDKTLFLEELIEVNAAWLMLIVSALYWLEQRRTSRPG